MIIFTTMEVLTRHKYFTVQASVKQSVRKEEELSARRIAGAMEETCAAGGEEDS